MDLEEEVDGDVVVEETQTRVSHFTQVCLFQAFQEEATFGHKSLDLTPA